MYNTVRKHMSIHMSMHMFMHMYVHISVHKSTMDFLLAILAAAHLPDWLADSASTVGLCLLYHLLFIHPCVWLAACPSHRR